jgi:hypothetical protein
MGSSPPRLRVIGLIVGLAVLALAGGFFFLSRGQSSSSASTTHKVVPLSQRNGAKPNKPAAKTPVAKTPASKTPAVKNPPAVDDDLPGSLSAELSVHRVVVVSLFAPNVDLDDMAMREARAGALAADVGFVALDVTNEREARPLTKEFGVLEDPAVLVFRRPGELVVRFSGFADKQTVAQAATNAGL